MGCAPLFFAGSSHPVLAKQTCLQLKIPLGNMRLEAFPDGETLVEVLEDVQGKEVFVLQSLAFNPNHYLMELLVIIDALKRSLATKITAIIPYLSYARQDRKVRSGIPITAKLIANLLSSAGIHQLITFDLHSDQVEGFFEIPVTHLRCQQLLSDTMKPFLQDNVVIAAPDIGGVKMAETMASCLGQRLVVIKKERLSPYDVQMALIGDVKGKQVVIVDDLCSTGGTLISAANLCKEEGAMSVGACITHGLFIESAMGKIEKSPLDFLFTTNTVALLDRVKKYKKLQEISVAGLIAEAVQKFQIKHF